MMRKVLGEILFETFRLPILAGALVAFVGAAFIIVAAALINEKL
jgi:hypothetical protein